MVISLRTTAWLDHKNTSIVSWRQEDDRTPPSIVASIDCSIFWGSSPSTSIEHFTWLYFHVLFVCDEIIHARRTVEIQLLNSQYLSSFLCSLLPSFEWSSERKLTFVCLPIEERIRPAFQTFAQRLAATLVLNLVPAWKSLENTVDDEDRPQLLSSLIAETNEIANNAILYFVPLSSLALAIAREVENHLEERFPDLVKRIFPIVREFYRRGCVRQSFHFFLLLHECIDVLLLN